MSIEKKNKLGEGAYGIVYAASVNKANKSLKVAVKRNYGDEENIGISCIREMNFLSLFSHPCITKLKSISCGDPFASSCPMTPRPKRNDMKEDSHHFILELADISLEDYYMECEEYYHLKVIMCQILLGMEYIHSKNVVHRDLKPGNILVNNTKDMPYAKICDFGLSCFDTNYRPSTPGTVTSWFRAPEICCEYEDYSYPSDMWSIGCIFYEIVTKKNLIQSKKDESKYVFREIVGTIPEKFSASYLTAYIKKGWCDYFKHGYTEKLTPGKRPFIDHIKERVDTEDFDSQGGSALQFCDLLDNIILLDPKKRLTASQCLAHPFFNVFKPYTDQMRKSYPLDNNRDIPLVIHDCLERRWAVNVCFKLYNNRNSVEWYSDYIIFHSLRIFDKYLEKYYKNFPRKTTAKGVGLLHTEVEVNIMIYTCIYIMYKYFSTLYRIFAWDEIFPPHIAKEENIETIVSFERLIVKEVCNYQVFDKTLIEMLDQDYKPKNDKQKQMDLRKYLINYGNIGMNYEGTLQDFYNQIKEGLV